MRSLPREFISSKSSIFVRARARTHTDLSFVNFTRPRQFLWSSTEDERDETKMVQLFPTNALPSDWCQWKTLKLPVASTFHGVNLIKAEKGKDRERGKEVCGLDTGKNTGNLLPSGTGRKKEGVIYPGERLNYERAWFDHNNSNYSWLGNRWRELEGTKKRSFHFNSPNFLQPALKEVTLGWEELLSRFRWSSRWFGLGLDHFRLGFCYIEVYLWEL